MVTTLTEPDASALELLLIDGPSALRGVPVEVRARLAHGGLITRASRSDGWELTWIGAQAIGAPPQIRLAGAR